MRKIERESGSRSRKTEDQKTGSSTEDPLSLSPMPPERRDQTLVFFARKTDKELNDSKTAVTNVATKRVIGGIAIFPSGIAGWDCPCAEGLI